MSCGRINFLSRIKWLFTFSFSKTKRPFETGKCHECLWCEYIEECMTDYTYFVKPEIEGDFDEVIGEIFDSGETHAVEDVNYMRAKNNLSSVYGMCVYDHVEDVLSDYYPNADEDGMVDVSDYPYTK